MAGQYTTEVDLGASQTVTLELTNGSSIFFDSDCSGTIESGMSPSDVSIDLDTAPPDSIIADGDNAFVFQLNEHRVARLVNGDTTHMSCMFCGESVSFEQSEKQSAYAHGLFYYRDCQSYRKQKT